MKRPVLAIDGPAGTGKSTTARHVARRLGWRHVDSGAFYRVASLLAQRLDLDLGSDADRTRLRRALESADLDFNEVGGRLHTLLDGEDVSDAIRLAAVTRIVSRVADDPGLREVVNAGLRARVGEAPAVVDGRDIGSVVFPDAFLKVYLDASPEVRARRRAREAEPPERAEDPSVLASYEQSLAERDRADRERPVAPLAAALDAVHLDTSELEIETQVARVVRLATERAGDLPAAARKGLSASP
ncbi:MAG TPA: (d)CMP kinase [Gemmatimonadota bacterium]|nr:(d)CMP kinase [Gemmatimonadota bacterium]